jgi:ATP synthase protein I
VSKEEGPQRPRKSKDIGNMRSIGIGMTLPMMMAATLVVSVAIGYYLDVWLGTKPWLLLLFLVLGIVAAIRETIILVRKMSGDGK